MVKENILVSVSEATDWVSSRVTVVKPNKLRIYIDPKDLNRSTLSKAKVISVLDAIKVGSGRSC